MQQNPDETEDQVPQSKVTPFLAGRQSKGSFTHLVNLFISPKSCNICTIKAFNAYVLDNTYYALCRRKPAAMSVRHPLIIGIK